LPICGGFEQALLSIAVLISRKPNTHRRCLEEVFIVFNFHSSREKGSNTVSFRQEERSRNNEMESTTPKAKVKRPSKGQRKHNRLVKQEARKNSIPGTVVKKGKRPAAK